MDNFLNFRRFITPTAIQAFFWLGAGVIIVSCLATMGYSYAALGERGPVLSLFFMVFGVISWRVWCELVLLAFRIYEALEAIRQNTVRQ